MKKHICIFISALALSSCSFLDVSTLDYHSTEYQFQDFGNTKTVLTNIYGYLDDQFTAQSREIATDNGQYAYEQNDLMAYYDGTWSVTNPVGDVWDRYYTAIRATNYFLDNCPDDFPAAKYQENYAQHKQQLQYYKWEARALRAYFHFQLLIRYKDIILADKCYSLEEVNGLKLTDYHSVASWIASECDAVAPNLPGDYNGVPEKEVNRVTKGFVLALKSRVLLYASSPLTAEENLSASGYDKKLAAASASAAKEVIDLKQYFLPKDIKFNTIEVKDNTYLIFGITRAASTAFEAANFPMGIEGGGGGACPSDNLAACFDFTDGTEFDWGDPVHAADPYTSRDPRFYKTIYYNGCQFKNTILQNYFGGENGLPKKGATPTGYYLAKLIVEDTDMTPGNTRSYLHVWPIFRYHEIYLNYAEALFEASESMTFTGELDGVQYDLSPLAALNEVRKAAGMPEISEGVGNEVFREKLRKERRIELAFEDHRFWDIRRWKIAPDVTSVYGVDITPVEGGSFRYSRNPVEITTGLPEGSVRVWKDCYYWHPYPRGETLKNHNIQQHSGWTN